MDVPGLVGVPAGGDQVADGAVDEELLLADHDRDRGVWLEDRGARCHDRSMPRHPRGGKSGRLRPAAGAMMAGLSGDGLAAEPDAARLQAERPRERTLVIGVP